jgi:hypothetical protein
MVESGTWIQAECESQLQERRLRKQNLYTRAIAKNKNESENEKKRGEKMNGPAIVKMV